MNKQISKAELAEIIAAKGVRIAGYSGKSKTAYLVAKTKVAVTNCIKFLKDYQLPFAVKQA